jgi:hypothetical protein
MPQLRRVEIMSRGDKEESFNTTIREGRSRESASYIAIGGWVLIGFSLNFLLFSSFPLRLAFPDWQLNQITGLLSTAPNILIGTLLVCLARRLSPEDDLLAKRTGFLRRASSWLAILLVLLIPIQLYLGFQLLRIQEGEGQATLKTWRKQLATIQTLTSEAELRSFVANLPNSPGLPAKFDAPFPVVKQRGIDNFTARINALQTRLESEKSQRLANFLPLALRNTIQALLMAIAFAGIGQRGRHQKSLLDELAQLLSPSRKRSYWKP